jgi:hypothetical protein
VIVAQWVSVAEHIGHYRPIEAYDDRQGVFVASDPLLGPAHAISYGDFVRIWAGRHGQFIVLYPPSRQALLNAVLAAAGWNKTRAYRAALASQLAHAHRSGAAGQEPGGGGAYYQYYNTAWYEVQLGQYAAARRTLRQGQVAGASPIVLGWIGAEIPS